MAGGKPVVSTPVPDVVADYGDVVRIAEGPERFVVQVEAALADRGAGPQARLSEKAGARSWERIAEEMERLVLEASAMHGAF